MGAQSKIEFESRASEPCSEGAQPMTDAHDRGIECRAAIACAKFVQWAMQEGPWQGNDLDGGSIQDRAESLGLLTRTKFDRSIHHDPNSDAEDGDDWFVLSDAVKALAEGTAVSQSPSAQSDGLVGEVCGCESIKRIEAMRNRLAAGETTFTLDELKLTFAWADHLNYFLSGEKVTNKELASRLEQERTTWRCFHCDEVFTDRAEALAHFGDNEGEEAGCKLTVLEGGLLKLYREAQEELRGYRQEDAAAHRTFYALGADHYQAVRRAEEEGYAKGLKDNSDREELKAELTALQQDRDRLRALLCDAEGTIMQFVETSNAGNESQIEPLLCVAGRIRRALGESDEL